MRHISARLKKRLSKKRVGSKKIALKNTQKRKFSVWSSIISFLLLLLVIFGISSIVALVVIRTAFVKFSAVDEEKTIVLAGTQVSNKDAVLIVAHLHPDVARSQITVIDAQSTVALPKGYGNYSMQSIVPLGLLDNQPAVFYTATFSHALERVVENVVPIEGEIQVSNTSQLQRLLLKQIVKSIFELRNHTELLSVYNALSHSSIKVVSLSEYLLKSHSMQMADVDMVSKCPVGILNSTRISGQAGKFTRILENSGLVVVRVGQEDVTYDRSTVYVHPDSAEPCQKVLQMVKKVFPIELEVVTQADIPDQYRASIIAVIGSDSVSQ